VIVPIASGGGVFALVFKLLGWVEKKNTEKKKTELDYSRKLVESVLIPRATIEIDFDTQNEHNLCIKLIGLPTTPEYKRYSNDADGCLKEYKNIQEIINNRDKLIEKHNNKSQAFLDKLTFDIISNIKQRIPIEGDNSTPIDSKRFFNRENIEPDIVKAIRSTYRTHESFQLYISGNFLNYRRGFWIQSNDKEELKGIKEAIESTFDIAVKSPDFNQLKNCFKQIKEDLHENYKKEIDKIIIETVDKNNPLKGIKL
jgi:hypothetical protein